MKEIPEDIEKIRIGHLIANTCRLHAIRTDRHMELFGLFRGQAILLMILSDNDGLTHSEIAEKLEISPAAATKVIKRLESLNYLQRQSDPADERISRVYLKEEGWAVIQRIRATFQQMDQVLISDFSQDEYQTLVKLLLRVYKNLLNQTTDST